MGRLYDNIFVEYYITLNCNLNCVACSSFSPLVKGTAYKDIKDIILETEKIIRITDNGKKIWKLSLMGGEPLLHPQLIEIIKYFGELGINLRLVTNGILIPKMDKEFFELITKYNVDLKVSVYKTVKYEKIFNKLEEHKVEFSTFNQKGTFGTQYLHNKKKGVTDCRYRGTMFILKDNKMFTCSETAFFSIFDAAFKGQHDLKLEDGDWVDMDDVETLEELREARKTIPSLCDYCDGSSKKRVEWKASENSIDEWLQKDK